MRKAYLAGPEVFLPDAREVGRAKKDLCRLFGFEGLFPLDAGADGQGSRAIYAALAAQIAAADFGIFNLTPFRGPSADVGTVFELGAFVGAGKPVFAYSNEAGDLLSRVQAAFPLRREDGAWRDAAGLLVEDFGNADNLMIDEALARQGRSVHRAATPDTMRFRDLGGFEACLREAAAHGTAPR